MKVRYCCPHCGWTYDPQAEKGWSFVPVHMKGQAQESIRCPGSGQAPRNADSDKRPLWQDGGAE